MKSLILCLYFLIFNIMLTIPLLPQSEQGYILGIKNFEKSFPTQNSRWDSYENLYMDRHYDGKIIEDKIDYNQFDFMKSENRTDNDLFSINAENEFDYNFYKDIKTMKSPDQKLKLININNFKFLQTWLETENTFVTIDLNSYKYKSSEIFDTGY